MYSYYISVKCYFISVKIREMTQRAKTLAAKLSNLNPTPGIHMLEGED